jgi:dihydropteroate synthase
MTGPISTSGAVQIMGVVNVTPDSFSDGGQHATAEAAITHGLRLVGEGADLVDVGGESTRPGAAAVSADDELGRVVPVVAALAHRTRVSIDTSKAAVAEAALQNGAQIVNDVSGGLLDPKLFEVVARHRATLVIGHLRGTPATMNRHAHYDDVVAEVLAELRQRIAVAREAGVEETHIWIDPGLGFAKRAEHSAAILARLDAFTVLGRPIVIGASRKSFLHALSAQDGELDLGAREEATAAAHAIAITRGASVVRVHDVLRQRPAIRVAQALRDADVGHRRS